MAEDHVRILSYNVLNGCHDRPRRKALHDFIRQSDADLAGIVEADRWEYREPEIARELGYPYTTTPAGPQDAFYKHMVLFSRFPIAGATYIPLARATDRPNHHGAINAAIDVHGKRLDILLCHLKYNSEPTRIREITTLLPCVDPQANTVLMGDFNSFAPDAGYDDAYEKQLEGFVRGYGGVTDLTWMVPRLWENRDAYKFGTIRRILAHYQDAHPGPMKPWYTLPTNISPVHPVCTLQPPEKLDYIFASKHLALVNPQVPRNSLTGIISDHYPVQVDIRTESLK